VVDLPPASLLRAVVEPNRRRLQKDVTDFAVPEPVVVVAWLSEPCAVERMGLAVQLLHSAVSADQHVSGQVALVERRRHQSVRIARDSRSEASVLVDEEEPALAGREAVALELESGQPVFAAGDPADEARLAHPPGRAGQFRTLLDRGAGDLLPIPDREDVLKFVPRAKQHIAAVGDVVALESLAIAGHVCVRDPAGEHTGGGVVARPVVRHQVRPPEVPVAGQRRGGLPRSSGRHVA